MTKAKLKAECLIFDIGSLFGMCQSKDSSSPLKKNRIQYFMSKWQIFFSVITPVVILKQINL